MEKDKKILVTGGTGFLGREVIGQFFLDGYENVFASNSKFDLRNKAIAINIINSFDIVVHLAANCGGIGYNRENSGTLFYDNMLMGINVLEACRLNNTEKLVFIGTVCAYPKYVNIPFLEEDLWNGYPEETNASYGIAKRSLFVMADAYKKQYGLNTICLLPVNMYGPNDRGFFDDERSHVISAIIKKFYSAKISEKKEVILWGTGNVSREFLYVNDAARAIVLAAEMYNEIGPINIGTGKEIIIYDLANMIANVMDYKGKIVWDDSFPDGQPRRCLNVERAQEKFGFKAETSLEKGLEKTINWYKNLKQGDKSVSRNNL